MNNKTSKKKVFIIAILSTVLTIILFFLFLIFFSFDESGEILEINSLDDLGYSDTSYLKGLPVKGKLLYHYSGSLAFHSIWLYGSLDLDKLNAFLQGKNLHVESCDAANCDIYIPENFNLEKEIFKGDVLIIERKRILPVYFKIIVSKEDGSFFCFLSYSILHQ